MTGPYARALVTGGAGFIGSHLVDALVAGGVRTTVIDDLSTGKAANLAEHERGGKMRLVRASILDAELVDRLVSEHDVVYHLAAAVGVRHIVKDPLKAILVNVRGTEHVLAAAERYRVRVLLASTSEIYGKAPAPFREDDDRVLGPTSVHRWSYSTAKAIDEHLAFAYAARGLAVSVVRYFNAYGPRIDERGYGSVIARFMAQALSGVALTVHGDGQQTRCFTYIDDTVRGTMLAAETPGAAGLVFNIGSSEEVSVAQLAELIRELCGSSSELVREPYEAVYGPGFEDTRRRVPDVARAQQVLGFTATVPLRDGLARTLDWCRANYALSGSMAR